MHIGPRGSRRFIGQGTRFFDAIICITQSVSWHIHSLDTLGSIAGIEKQAFGIMGGKSLRHTIGIKL